MSKHLILFLCLIHLSAFAGIVKKDKSNGQLPELTLSMSDTMLLNQIKKKKKLSQDVIVTMVCKLKTKKGKCQVLEVRD